GDHLHQIAVDQPHGFQRVGIGQRAVAGGDERLDGVYQRVDAGTGRQEGVHARRGFRADQRNVRHRRLADDGELHALVLVGDDHELRNVGRGAGRGGNQDQRRAGHAQGIHPFELDDMATVGDHDADALGAVHRAAAAHRDDHVATFVAIDLGTEHHLFATRVGRYIGEQVVLDVLPLKAGLHVGYPASGHHTGVGNHQHLARAEVAGAGADTVAATGTEDDFRGNEFTLEADIRAHHRGLYYFL